MRHTQFTSLKIPQGTNNSPNPILNIILTYIVVLQVCFIFFFFFFHMQLYNLCIFCRNFVLQHVLGLDDPVFNEKICSILRGHYIRLSSQKGGSFVVEKCLNSNGMIYVIQDLLSYNRLCHLARNQYGNFVIQAALKATKVNFLNLYSCGDYRFYAH